MAPQILLYGVTPRLTAFGILPVLAHREVEAGGLTLMRDEAIGDFTLLGRYTVYQDDYAPLSTRRLALLGGVKSPSGADRFGTPSFDPSPASSEPRLPIATSSTRTCQGTFLCAFGRPGDCSGDLGRPMNLTVHRGELYVSE